MARTNLLFYNNLFLSNRKQDIRPRALSAFIQTPMNPSALAPPFTSPQARFHRIARFARRLVLAGGVLFVLNALATWFFADYAAHIIKCVVNVEIVGPLTPKTRVMYVLWDIISLAVILAALLHLWHLFGEYLQSRIFSVRALSSLRGFARWVLAAAVLSPIYRAGLSVIVTWQNGPGKRELMLSLASNDYLVLLLGVAIFAISSVMAEAARIAEENEGFV